MMILLILYDYHGNWSVMTDGGDHGWYLSDWWAWLMTSGDHGWWLRATMIYVIVLIVIKNKTINYDWLMIVDDWLRRLVKIINDLDYDDWSWWLIDLIIMWYECVTSKELVTIESLEKRFVTLMFDMSLPCIKSRRIKNQPMNICL